MKRLVWVLLVGAGALAPLVARAQEVQAEASIDGRADRGGRAERPRARDPENGFARMRIDAIERLARERGVDQDGDGRPEGRRRDRAGEDEPVVRRDRDGDGRPDVRRDRDGDGVPDVRRDRNGDGRPDIRRDRDGDGVPDLRRDRDGDGRPDLRRDRNGDGVPDFRRDRDGDGLPDLRRDRDGDGRPDFRRGRDGRFDDRRDRDRGDVWGDRGWDDDRDDRRGEYWGRDAYRGGQVWNRGWRNDRRYDWNGYRQRNRGAYRLPRYYAPRGYGYSYRRFDVGVTLNRGLFAPDYWLDDPYAYRLPPAYGPYRWVRYYGDALLVDLRTGRVIDVVHDIFG